MIAVAGLALAPAGQGAVDGNGGQRTLRTMSVVALLKPGANVCCWARPDMLRVGPIALIWLHGANVALGYGRVPGGLRAAGAP